MEIVDNLFNDISERIGRLVNLGVFTLEEGARIIKTISNKETEWMQNNFSNVEIYEFLRGNSPLDSKRNGDFKR